MKIQSFYRFMIVVLLIAVIGTAAAQDFTGGTVTYQKTTRYDFQSLFGTFTDPYAIDWLASLPSQNQSVKLLHFTNDKALYRQDPSQPEITSEKLLDGLAKAEYYRPPQSVLLQVYSDFNSNKVVRQVEFMTRVFRISGPFEKKAWKLTNNMVKILDYTCMGAETKQNDKIITSYFTSEIPVSAGPAGYGGLPGLILAIEINGETAFLATSIDLTRPEEGVLTKPDKGREVTQEKFDKIIEEKIKEWKETRAEGKGGKKKK